MALTERLQILVDGNAQGAIREFQKLGTAADRELGKTEDKLAKLSGQLTSFGTGLLAGGAVAIGGLKQLADSASAYGEQVSAASVTFGEEGAAQLEKFAEAAADTANISKTEATKAANSFATFARQAGLTGTAAVKFSTDLVQLAGDISSFRDISVADALAALQSGLAGEGEPIRRLGGDISDVALKAEYLAVTGENVTGTLTQQQKVVAINSKLFKDFELAQGDVVRTQDSLANQTRNAQANFENLKTELGTGLVPVFATLVGAVSNALGSLGQIGDEEANLGGRIAGIATAATLATGAVSILAGQALRLRDTFTTLGDDGTRSLNNVGRAAAGISIGATVISGLFALDAALNAADQSASDLKQTTDQLLQGLGRQQNFDALLEKTRQLDGGYEDLKESVGQFFNIRPLQTRFTFIDGIAVDVNDLRESFESLIGQPEALRNALESLEGRQFLTAAGGVDEETLALITEYEGKLNDSTKAQEAQAAASEEQATAAGGVTDGLTEQKTAFERAEQALANYNDSVAILKVNYEGLSERASAFKDAIERSTTLDDEIAAASSLGGAFKTARENFGALPAEIDFAALALGVYNEEQTKAIDSFLTLGDRSQDFLSTLLEQNRTYDEVRFAAGLLREEYARQLEQLGLNDEQVYAYITTLGLTPDQVETAIVLSGEETARFKIEAYQGLIERTPPEKLTSFEAAIAQGDFIAAAAELDRLAQERTVPITPVVDPTFVSKFFSTFGFSGRAPAPITFPRAEGGAVASGMAYTVGERGPELFVPRASGTIVPNDQLRGGTLNLTQNIVSADPIQTAAEVVRRQRDAEFLAGV